MFNMFKIEKLISNIVYKNVKEKTCFFSKPSLPNVQLIINDLKKEN